MLPPLRRMVYAAVAVLLTTAAVAGCGAARPHAARRNPPAAGITLAPAPRAATSSPTSLSRDQSRAPVPAQGQVLVRTIPGGDSRFHARPAEVYLPPRVLDDPHARMPVLELLHGVPGAPTDWVQKGQLLSVADSFAASHGGAAPIIVMPDINGSEDGDTECIRTPGSADVERYLSQTVPTWIAHHLPATTDHRQWIVAGLSEGGTCAAMLSLRHPQVFPAFADFSGLAHLTLGKTNDRALTTGRIFVGSAAAYDQHDPLWLLRHGHVHTTAAWFASGTTDLQDLRDQSALARAAAADGVSTSTAAITGGHHWVVWTSALEHMLPWFWQRIGG